MPSIKPIGNKDKTTRAYLDEIGKIPRIDHRKEPEHGPAIERRAHIRKQRTRHRKPQDCNFTDSILRYINGSAPTISGLFRHAGLAPNPHIAEVATYYWPYYWALAPNPHIAEVAHNRDFRAQIDRAPTEPVTEVARRWSGITDTNATRRTPSPLAGGSGPQQRPQRAQRCHQAQVHRFQRRPGRRHRHAGTERIAARHPAPRHGGR